MSDRQLPASEGSRIAESLLFSQASLAAPAIVILLLCWFAFAWLGVRASLSSGTEIQTVPNTTPDPKPNSVNALDNNQAAVNAQVASYKYDEAERQLLLKIQKSKVDPRLNSLKAAFAEIQRLEAAWRQRLDALKANADGRRLATEEGAFKIRFLSGAIQSKVSDISSMEEWSASIQNILAKARGPIEGIEDVEDRLAQSESLISETLAVLKQSKLMLDAMLADAGEPQIRTLETTMSAADNETAKKITDSVTHRLKTLEAAHAEQMAAAELEQAKSKTRLAVAEKRLESAKAESAQRLGDSEKALDNETTRLAAEKAELRRQMESELPAMRSLLSPFITPGYRQPSVDTHLEVTPDALPISLSRLMRSRALEDSKKGMETMLILADSDSNYQPRNDRPHGSFPNRESETDIGKPEILRTLRTVQEFLRKYGDVMVEAKLLSP